MCLENEIMYNEEFTVPEEVMGEEFLIPIGKAKIMREGMKIHYLFINIFFTYIFTYLFINILFTYIFTNKFTYLFIYIFIFYYIFTYFFINLLKNYRY